LPVFFHSCLNIVGFVSQNGKKITPDIRYKTLEEDNTNTLLIIETVPEDSGQYECVAINSAGNL
jgi:titin